MGLVGGDELFDQGGKARMGSDEIVQVRGDGRSPYESRVLIGEPGNNAGVVAVEVATGHEEAVGVEKWADFLSDFEDSRFHVNLMAEAHVDVAVGVICPNGTVEKGEVVFVGCRKGVGGNNGRWRNKIWIIAGDGR